MRRITLRSPHDPVAVATRLQAAIADTLDPGSARQVTGNGNEHEMRLRVHRPFVYNNYATQLVATLEPDGSGTRITGTIGPPRFMMLFTGCWLVFVALFGVGAGGIALAGNPPWELILSFVGIPLLMFAIGTGLLVVGRRHGAGDARELRAFLRRTIDATDESEQPGNDRR